MSCFFVQEEGNIDPEEPETRIDVEIPKISADLGEDIHFVKLPNFLSVETRFVINIFMDCSVVLSPSRMVLM